MTRARKVALAAAGAAVLLALLAVWPTAAPSLPTPSATPSSTPVKAPSPTFAWTTSPTLAPTATVYPTEGPEWIPSQLPYATMASGSPKAPTHVWMSYSPPIEDIDPLVAQDLPPHVCGKVDAQWWAVGVGRMSPYWMYANCQFVVASWEGRQRDASIRVYAVTKCFREMVPDKRLPCVAPGDPVMQEDLILIVERYDRSPNPPWKDARPVEVGPDGYTQFVMAMPSGRNDYLNSFPGRGSPQSPIVYAYLVQAVNNSGGSAMVIAATAYTYACSTDKDSWPTCPTVQP